MSYDVWLEVDTGGPEPARIGEGLNMTSNVAPMWRKAGADIAEFHGKVASECTPLLGVAIEAMRADREAYEVMNPPNGWGSYETCLRFLGELKAEFEAHPKATVHVWR